VKHSISESFNDDLKSYLKWNIDIVRFFKHFERVLLQKRQKEIEWEYEMRRKQPRIKMNVPILQQPGALYTPKIIEIFQVEWEISIADFI
jgi:zinc finger SWIM domain-containing protein 3